MDNTEKIDLSSLLKAQKVFENFRINMITDRDKAGAVQAFEFSYELAWRFMKRFLHLRGVDVASPKETFRNAALEKFIEDPEIWFTFQQVRNLTVHTYNEANVETIISYFDNFSRELSKLIKILLEIND